MPLYEQAVTDLGYSPYAIPCSTLSEEYENPDGQTLYGCQYNGFCGSFACEWGAITSPITTVIPTAQATDNFYPGMNGQHNGGGVIMGDDSENSAVNNYMQMWDMENLFVCGASSFPHFGPTNPTLTMGALTYRATEGMMKYLDGDGGMLVKSNKKSLLA